MILQSSLKAIRYVDDKKVFPLQNTPTLELWCIEANTGVYVVRYDKMRDRHTCNCKNVRLTPCAHIKAVEIYKAKKKRGTENNENTQYLQTDENRSESMHNSRGC
jgi:hypothetical protein